MIVTTSGGPVRGRATAHGPVFHGVPYAAPPVGRLRFAAPRPHTSWTRVRDATVPGPTAPQPARDLFGSLDMSPYFGPGWRRGADYLTVDVWAPHTARGAPVLVFVPGGGFVAGSPAAPVYDGGAFQRDGIVLVTVGYRLGVPGFLHLPGAPDNRGLLDVIAALRWVRANAARFGGDPGNVTLAGQSAGATIVAGALAAPAAAGLARRAVLQSGNGFGAFTPEQAGRVTAALGRSLGLVPSVGALAPVPDADLVAAIPELAGLDLRTATHHDPLGGITPFGLVLARQPGARLPVPVDLLLGTNADEGALYLAAGSRTEDDLTATAARFHPEPERLVAAYRAARPGATTAELRTALLGDGLFGAGTFRTARAHRGRTHAYEFTWRSNALDGRLGASHVMELPFVFDNTGMPALHGPHALLGTAPPPIGLAARMHAAWVRFAATGDPGWPALVDGRYRVQRIGAGWELADDPYARELAAWGDAQERESHSASSARSAGVSRPRSAGSGEPAAGP